MSIKHLSYALLGGVLALGAGPAAAAAITCAVTPEYSVQVDGESLTLAALCNGALSSIDWRMDGVSVSGVTSLPGHVAGEAVYFTTPVGAGGTNSFAFTVSGVPASTANTFGGSGTARVTVKPSSAVVAKAAGVTAPTIPVAASCGSANSGTVAVMPSGVAACSSGKSVLRIAGPSAFNWTCESWTGGADASCYAMRGAAAAPTTPPPTVTTNVNGACSTAANVAALAPPTNGCAVGTATPVITTSTQYSWSCSGTGTGSATGCFAPRSYAVTATAGTGGTISPASKTVAAYASTTFTVTPFTGYTAKVTGCNGMLSGTTYTTSPISAGCSVSASFTAAATLPALADPGKGLWVPAGYPNLYVVDQSGTGISTSYVPGCLNGASPGSSSWSGCAANTSFTANGVKVEMMKGKILSVRYKSKSTAGVSKKWFTLAGGDGSNSGPTYVWLTDDPRKTYAQTDSKCKAYSTSAPSVLTGHYNTATYCTISPNKAYYLNIESDLTAPTRFKIFEDAADMLL